MTIHDFVSKLCQDYPALIDYLGFYEEDIEIEGNGNVYEPHLELETLTEGVKRGEFFQGKLSTDRYIPEEGFYLIYPSIYFNFFHKKPRFSSIIMDLRSISKDVNT